jgi:hypothetical protein
MLAESTNAPLRFEAYAGPPPADRWLAGRAGAVVRLPAGADDTRAMLDGVAHFRPLVNGDSGFVPRPYARAQELLAEQPWDERLRFLRAVGVTHVVSDGDAPLPPLERFGATRVYAVPAGESASPPGPDAAPRPTLWTPAGIVLELGAERPVSGVVFELDDRPWLAAPTLEVSSDGRSWRPWPAAASLADAALALYADPRRGRGALRFPEVSARYLRLDPALPARHGALAAATR